MPGIVGFVRAISDDVVESLAIAGYPALTEGKIVLGRQYQFEHSAPPRIIFVPTTHAFDVNDVFSATGAYTEGQLLNRSFMTDQVTYEIRCWGTAPDRDPDYDYDFTQVLYQQVIRSLNQLSRGSFTIDSATWTDSRFQSAQLDRDGREYVMLVTVFTPILELLEPLLPAPVETEGAGTTILQLPTGELETGCQD